MPVTLKPFVFKNIYSIFYKYINFEKISARKRRQSNDEIHFIIMCSKYFFSLILEVKESSGVKNNAYSFSVTCSTWNDSESRKLASFGEYLEFSQLMLRIKELPNSLIILNIQFSSIMNSIFTHIWENYIGKLIYRLLLGFREYCDVKAEFSLNSLADSHVSAHTWMRCHSCSAPPPGTLHDNLKMSLQWYNAFTAGSCFRPQQSQRCF